MNLLIVIAIAVVLGGLFIARFVFFVRGEVTGDRDPMSNDPVYRAKSRVPFTQAWINETGRRRRARSPDSDE